MTNLIHPPSQLQFIPVHLIIRHYKPNNSNTITFIISAITTTMGYSHDTVFSCPPPTTVTVTVTADGPSGSSDMDVFAASFVQFLNLLERLFGTLTDKIDNGLQKTWIKKGMFGIALVTAAIVFTQLLMDTRRTTKQLAALDQKVQALQRLPGPQGVQGPTGANGRPGLQGPQGVQGPAGANGLHGANGIRGLDGSPGQQGPRGWRGVSGRSRVCLCRSRHE